MTVSLKSKPDTAPARSRRFRYKAWQSFLPIFKVKAGAKTLSIPAIAQPAIMFPEEWPNSWRLQLMRQIFRIRSGAFIDVGANTGQTMIDFLITGSREDYYGFEPNPECVTFLSKIIERNGLGDLNIIPAGLADRSGVLKFFVSKKSNADSGGSLLSGLRPERELRSFYVPCYQFDEIRSEFGIGAISLIKIDVEGGELMTLLGMRQTLQTARPWVIVEVLHRDAHASEDEYHHRLDQILALNKDIGYRLHAIQNPGMRPR